MSGNRTTSGGKVLLGLALIGVVAFAIFFLGQRNRVAVMDAVRATSDTVELGVNSCNQNPTAEVEQIEPGVYEVLVRTTGPANTLECQDLVTIEVDPEDPVITIIDRTSGDRFELEEED